MPCPQEASCSLRSVLLQFQLTATLTAPYHFACVPRPPGADHDCGAGLWRSVLHAGGGRQVRRAAQEVPRPVHPGEACVLCRQAGRARAVMYDNACCARSFPTCESMWGPHLHAP